MNEAHQRFHDWLTAGAEDDPPRDIAVHASVCPGCRASIAALDALAIVDPGFASMPAPPTGAERGRLALAGRLVGATGVVAAAIILGVGISQFLGVSRSGSPVAQATARPEQNVLGQTATPEPSPEATATPTFTMQETLTPLGTPTSTHRPPVVTPAPIRTAPPTPVPTAPPTPPPIPTATPTPMPSVSETPLATATATPLPPSPTPIPLPSVSTLPLPSTSP